MVSLGDRVRYIFRWVDSKMSIENKTNEVDCHCCEMNYLWPLVWFPSCVKWINKKESAFSSICAILDQVYVIRSNRLGLKLRLNLTILFFWQQINHWRWGFHALLLPCFVLLLLQVWFFCAVFGCFLWCSSCAFCLASVFFRNLKLKCIAISINVVGKPMP